MMHPVVAVRPVVMGAAAAAAIRHHHFKRYAVKLVQEVVMGAVGAAAGSCIVGGARTSCLQAQTQGIGKQAFRRSVSTTSGQP